MLVDNFLNKKEKITILNLQKRNLTINLGQVYSNANLLDDKQMSQFILFIYKFVCLFWREREREREGATVLMSRLTRSDCDLIDIDLDSMIRPRPSL